MGMEIIMSFVGGGRLKFRILEIKSGGGVSLGTRDGGRLDFKSNRTGSSCWNCFSNNRVYIINILLP